MKFKRKDSSDTTETKGLIVGTGLAPRRKLTIKLPQFPKGRTRIFTGAFISVLIITVVLGLVLTRDKKVAAAVCNDILSQAAPKLDVTKSRELKELVNQIESRKAYDRDPNCLNIVITYYIDISDYENARKGLDALELVYNPAVKFSNGLGRDARNIETLRSRVDTLEKSRSQLDDYAKKRTLIINE